MTALMEAVRAGDLDLMQTLIKAGADVNATADNEATALLLAIGTSNAEAVKILIASGKLDIEAKLEDNTTPLIFAALHSSLEVLRELIATKANIDAYAKDGLSALLAAIIRDDAKPELAIALIKAGADVNARHNEKMKPLILAIHRKADLSVIEALIQNGADVNAIDARGLPALQLAKALNRPEAIIKALQEKTSSQA